MPAHLDDPLPGLPVDPLCFLVRGWLWLDVDQSAIAAVDARIGDSVVGETRTLFSRPDVNAALRLPPAAHTGFELFAHLPQVPVGSLGELALHARLHDGTQTPPLARRTTTFIGRDYRQAPYGVLLRRENTHVHRREHIYSSGPSIDGGSTELAALLRRYLGSPPCKVLDVGCGLGFYGRGLRADGYDWFGVEIDAEDCAGLAQRGLPHQQVDGRSLPFADAAFDAAMCIEVLEHIDEPGAFLREVRRVAPHRLIVSVPNCELLSYMADHQAVPWHLLESTHVNFFTRWSLASLLREYYAQVEVRLFDAHPLRTAEGLPMHQHLLGIASG